MRPWDSGRSFPAKLDASPTSIASWDWTTQTTTKWRKTLVAPPATRTAGRLLDDLQRFSRGISSRGWMPGWTGFTRDRWGATPWPTGLAIWPSPPRIRKNFKKRETPTEHFCVVYLVCNVNPSVFISYYWMHAVMNDVISQLLYFDLNRIIG